MPTKEQIKSALQDVPNLMTITEVAKTVRVSQRTIYRMVVAGDFPKPAKFGNRNLWFKAEVVANLESRFSKRYPRRRRGRY